MNKVIAKIIEIGLMVLTTTIMLFNLVMWCYTTTFQRYTFTLLVGEFTMTKFLGDAVGVYILYSTSIVFCRIVATIYLAFKQCYPSNFSSTPYGQSWRLL